MDRNHHNRRKDPIFYTSRETEVPLPHWPAAPTESDPKSREELNVWAATGVTGTVTSGAMDMVTYGSIQVFQVPMNALFAFQILGQSFLGTVPTFH